MHLSLAGKEMSENKFFYVQTCAKKEARKILYIIPAIILSGLISVYLSPAENFAEIIGIETVNGCPLLTLTGIPCPFCGMGRVFSCITDFYIAQTFYHNPSGLVFYLVSGIVLVYVTFLALKNQKIVFKNDKIVWIPVGFILIMWILNILFGHHD